MRSRLFQLVRSSVLHSLLPHQPVKGPFCPNVLRSLLVKGLFHFFLIARLYQTPVPAVIFFLTHAFPFLLLLSQAANLFHLPACSVHSLWTIPSLIPTLWMTFQPSLFHVLPFLLLLSQAATRECFQYRFVRFFLTICMFSFFFSFIIHASLPYG